MGRTKKSIGIYPLGRGFEGFRPDHKVRVREMLGNKATDELIAELEKELDGWLLQFESYRELRYGNEERRRARKLVKSATELKESINELGTIGSIVLDRYAHRHGIDNSDFLAVLSDLEEAVEYLDELASREVNLAAMQMQAIQISLEASGIPVTVSHDTRGVAFYPSPFVELIDFLWELEPRLRLYKPRSPEKWPNLSQWVSARLCEDVDFSSLKLLRRKRLK